MHTGKPRIAIVTFTDDRDVGLYSREVENRIRKKQSVLKTFLLEQDIEVLDPLDKMRGRAEIPYGIRNSGDIERALSMLLGQNIHGIIIGSWNCRPPCSSWISSGSFRNRFSITLRMIRYPVRFHR